MANLKIPKTSSGIGQPNSIGVPNLPSTGELLGTALSGFGEAMSQKSQYETEKVIRQNPPKDIFLDVFKKIFDYEEYTPDGEIDLPLSYKKLNLIIKNSDLLLKKAKEEAFERVDSLNVNFSGKKEISRQVNKHFEELNDSLSLKNIFVKQKETFENNVLKKFSNGLKTFNLNKQGEVNNSQNQHYFSVNEVALEESIDFYESLSPEDKTSKTFESLKALIVGAQSSQMYEQTYYSFLNAIYKGQGSDFAEATKIDTGRFSNWAEATGIYNSIKDDPNLILDFAKVFNAQSISFPKSFVKNVYEPFMSKPSYSGKEVDAFYALIEASKFGAQDISSIVTKRIEYFIETAPKAPSARGLNELLSEYNSFRKPKSNKDLLEDINAILPEDVKGLTEMYSNFKELKSLDDRISKLTGGSKNTFISEFLKIQKEELRKMVNEGILFTIGDEVSDLKTALKNRSYRRFMEQYTFEEISPYVVEPIPRVGRTVHTGISSISPKEYEVLPSVPQDRGVYVSSVDFKRALEDKLTTLLKLEYSDPEKLKKEVQKRIRNGSVIKTNSPSPTYMFELNNESLFSISQEEIVLNTIDPSAIVSVADLTFNINDTMKASLGIRSGKSNENYDLFKDWQKSPEKNVLKGYPYQEQAVGITSTEEFKSLDQETQKEVLSYLGNRIGYVTTQNPLYTNPAFLKKYKETNYSNYDLAYTKYFKDLTKMENSELKNHLKEVTFAPFTFDLLYENELALVSSAEFFTGVKKSVKAPAILNAFASKVKRLNEKEALYGESPPQNIKPYIDAEIYTASEIADAINISSDDLNDQIGEIDFDNSIIISALRYYFSSLLIGSELEQMPMAMTDKQLKAVFKVLESRK